ncbi:mRNA interferase MazF [Desulfofundulus luciae]|uniref:mRNA interferase MazF n=1 Tax=Desulfofundulus luciae TaxID=74702 RepID=A0ABU0B3E9_9FIRM|nr:type II toxin-antitoxin system PemK/MazF family toxin [Desulfofundulus luciae]MDQ0287248.1 mRNA interferase MazF [Desulfofundulus luciae]
MPNPGEVVVTNFAYSNLSGAKVRPALVVSKPEFTAVTGLVVVAAISGQPVKNAFEYALNNWKEAGLNLPSKVCAGKLFAVNSSLVKKIGKLSESDFVEVKKLLANALV